MGGAGEGPLAAVTLTGPCDAFGDACRSCPPFANPRRAGPRSACSLRFTPALRGFGYGLRPRTSPAVSPAFGRCASCKPGDPPPPSRPTAARASNRTHGRHRGPIPTPDGLKAAGEVPPAPSTPAERLAMWCDRLPSPAPEMLRTLAKQGERYIDAEELAATLGKKPSGGHWNSGIAVLHNNGLIEADDRRYRVAELFRK
jgi:hypothetical protein